MSRGGAARGQGNVYEGAPGEGDATPIGLRRGFGLVDDLALGCLPLPTNNTVEPDSVPWPQTFVPGRTSRPFGPDMARTLRLNAAPAYPKLPTTFRLAFPEGTFTLAGIVSDFGTASTRPLSLTNAIVVVAVR